jgi:hypothetical protein
MLFLRALLKKILHIILLVALLNTAFFVPQFSNSNTLTIENNAINEPDGELGSILAEILFYCFDIDVANTLNQNEEFVKKDLSIKRIVNHVLQFFVDDISLKISFEGISASKNLNALSNNAMPLLKFEVFFTLLYLH